jgi:hypothetical protein
MTKLKTVEFPRIEKETELELPVYLYFQDEDCQDTVIKVEEKKQIKISHNHFGVSIEISSLIENIPPHYLKNLTSKEHFDKELASVLEEIKVK